MPDAADGSEANIRYVKIETALASGAGFDWTDDGDTTAICKKAKFREMRDLSYSLFDVPHLPAPEKERILLSIVVKLDGDKRRLKVPSAVTRAVQDKYPEIDIEWHVVAHEGVEAQVRAFAWLLPRHLLGCCPEIDIEWHAVAHEGVEARVSCLLS